MPLISRSTRRWFALTIWFFGIVILFALGWWNINCSRHDAENRIISEAARTAAQLASLLPIPVASRDEMGVNAIIAAAMEDDRIYAIKVETDNGIVAGQRRNYLWEPMEWDDELEENCVQGMNTLKLSGQREGKVEVWLSPRLNGEEESLLLRREYVRFILSAGIWTIALFLVIWQWGDIRRLILFFKSRTLPPPSDNQEQAKIILGLGKSDEDSAPAGKPEDTRTDIINAAKGRAFQRQHPDAWLVTAGMFRQTFARGPELISRLYADGELAGLCHLGRMLEQAAPCIGAHQLYEAAKDMQKALNDPLCKTRAKPVEECARALDEVLDALCGNGQWRSRPESARS